jgi:hypothetical protein
MARAAIALLVFALAWTAAPAFGQDDPDPEEFTPVGYEFCGWRDLQNGRWVMEWDDDLQGASLIAFARDMTCRVARRNVLGVRYTNTTPRRPVRKGYRCAVLEDRHEYQDVRCTKLGRSSVAFRYRAGS